MRILVLLLTSFALSACSNLSPYSSVTPIDQAVKACGLGYSAEAGIAFKAAFQYADKFKGVDFEAKMKEALESQVLSMLKAKEVGGRMDSKDLAAVIVGTQSCVIKFAEAYRPKTRSDIVSACIKDLQSRVSGAGSTQSSASVRNWVVDSESSVGELTKLKVKASLYEPGHGSQNVGFYCLVRNDAYEDIEVIEEK